MKQLRNITYAEIEATKKDCLCKGLRIVEGFSEQGSKCNILHLKVSPETISSEMIQANKKAFIFWQGNCMMNVLHPSLSKSFALNISSRNSMKNSTLWYFCKIFYTHNLQSWWLFERWLLFYFSRWNSSLHIMSNVLFTIAFKYLWRKWLRKFRFAK